MKTINQQTKEAAISVFIIGLVCMAASQLSGCGVMGATGLTGPQGPKTSSVPVESSTQQEVDEANQGRVVQGLTPFTQGLACTVQLMASGQWLSSSSPGYNSAQGVLAATVGAKAWAYLFTDAFNQPDTSGGVNGLIPAGLQSLFVGNNYKITCNGQIVVVTPGYYGFDVNSDDGSIVTIDGTQVVNNDGNHSMTDKTGTALLTEGVHTFNLLYAQSGGGNFGLVIQANGSVVPSTSYYH